MFIIKQFTCEGFLHHDLTKHFLILFGFILDNKLEPDELLSISEPEQKEEEEGEISVEQIMEKAAEEGEEPVEEGEGTETNVEEPDNNIQDVEVEDSGILSDKERQNEELNEKDNCSASSISSSSSTLERETGKGEKISGIQMKPVNEERQVREERWKVVEGILK